jgi:hypothetical protein
MGRFHQFVDFWLRIAMVISETFSSNYTKAPAFQVSPKGFGIANPTKSKDRVLIRMAQRCGALGRAMLAKPE